MTLYRVTVTHTPRNQPETVVRVADEVWADGPIDALAWAAYDAARDDIPGLGPRALAVLFTRWSTLLSSLAHRVDLRTLRAHPDVTQAVWDTRLDARSIENWWRRALRRRTPRA